MIEPDSTHALSHRGDPDTSRAAAPTDRAIVKDAILNLLRDCPGTAFQIADRYFAMRAERGWPLVKYDSIAKRMSELSGAGQVEDTGRRVISPHNKASAVMEVVR